MNLDRLIAALTPEAIEGVARAICEEAGLDPDACWQDHREEAKQLIAIAVKAAEGMRAT